MLDECYPDGFQHILFVLDTSSSIDENEFDRVTAALSDLIVLFCRPIKIAAMTFDHEYYVEFCFNCFDNTCGGRVAASTAMRNINYSFNRQGERYTHTGGAAECVDDVILSLSCGVEPTASCIDVVFLTDGRSNDPNREVCTDILNLRNRFGVNTFAIGIDNAFQDELVCISEAVPGEVHLFNFLDFDDFEREFLRIRDVLLAGSLDPNDDPYVCIDPQVGEGVDGCQ